MPPDASPRGGTDIATIHLDLDGRRMVFPLTVHLGPRTLLDLLPPARELTAQATAVAVAGTESRGARISCGPGCGACCRQLVAISVVEALALADLVESMPPARQAVVRERFADALRRLESAGLLAPNSPGGQRAMTMGGDEDRRTLVARLGQRYFALGIPCPFLDEESCGIHPERPLVCREYHVTSPAARCADLYRTPVDAVQPPLHMSDVLARTAARVAGVPRWTIPLVLALEWSRAHGPRLRESRDGLELFQALLQDIDEAHEQPFERR